jgi:hypothetical protein
MERCGPGNKEKHPSKHGLQALAVDHGVCAVETNSGRAKCETQCRIHEPDTRLRNSSTRQIVRRASPAGWLCTLPVGPHGIPWRPLQIPTVDASRRAVAFCDGVDAMAFLGKLDLFAQTATGDAIGDC